MNGQPPRQKRSERHSIEQDNPLMRETMPIAERTNVPIRYTHQNLPYPRSRQSPEKQENEHSMEDIVPISRSGSVPSKTAAQNQPYQRPRTWVGNQEHAYTRNDAIITNQISREHTQNTGKTDMAFKMFLYVVVIIVIVVILIADGSNTNRSSTSSYKSPASYSSPSYSSGSSYQTPQEKYDAKYGAGEYEKDKQLLDSLRETWTNGH